MEAYDDIVLGTAFTSSPSAAAKTEGVSATATTPMEEACSSRSSGNTASADTKNGSTGTVEKGSSKTKTDTKTTTDGKDKEISAKKSDEPRMECRCGCGRSQVVKG